MRAGFAVAVLALGSTVALGSQAARPGQAPPRDTPAAASRTGPEAPATSRITGRVIAADTGRPVSRARVLVSGTTLAEGRGTLTDNEGQFEIVDLPDGRYTLTAGKAGFITIAYGQRRPFQPGTPLQVTAGVPLPPFDLRLPRGSVITGRVIDENGDPLPGASVRVMRYQYAQGVRTLVQVGGAQTDDLGAYRVWGLNPGQYFVSAVLPPVRFGRGRGVPPAVPGPQGRRGGPPQGAEPEQEGYAPTFYPSVPSVDEARPVVVGLSAEATAIDIAVLLVRTARLTGIVTGPDGAPTTAGNVVLTPEGTAQRGGPGSAYGSRIDWDGSFGIYGVPPGRYLLRARADDTAEPHFALQPVVVTGDDVTGLRIVLAPAARVTGTVVFQTTQSAAPDTGQVRVGAPFADGVTFGPNPTARIDRDGRFTLEGLQAGAHLLRAQGAPRGWTLQSVQLDGSDVTDVPLDLRAGQTLSGVRLVFTDRLTEVNGTIRDERGAPVTDYTVLAFSENEVDWRPLSRHIAVTRPDQTGRFQVRGLPPGTYLLALIDPVEPGEWSDPALLATLRADATRVSIGDGEVRTQDFTVSSR